MMINGSGVQPENVHIRFDADLLEPEHTETPVSEAHTERQRKQNPFPYGNNRGYYRKRIGSRGIDDPRLLLFDEKWFRNKDVMDIGCHEGYIAINLAQMYVVNSMRGIDIDNGLVTQACKHLELEAESPSCAAPLEEVDVDAMDYECDDTDVYDAVPYEYDEIEDTYSLLERVTFETANFLTYEIDDGCIDTILCLSVTKWVHLNWGDEGLMALFQKMYNALRPGGVLILEPQMWKSYRKNRKTNQTIHNIFLKLKLRPNEFTNILINDIGFNSCEMIARTIPSAARGFDRPIYLYTK